VLVQRAKCSAGKVLPLVAGRSTVAEEPLEQFTVSDIREMDAALTAQRIRAAAAPSIPGID
jgi:hypothetical protein